MTQDQRPYYDNPYLTSSTGGREKMNFVRSTLLICATLLLSIAVYTLYNYYQNRYIIVAQDSGLYVFDRKDSQVHFCDQENCKAVTPKYTLQAMIQAMPQTGLGGGKAITLPPSIHSALGDQGNPMALAQSLLAQAGKQKPDDSANFDLDSSNFGQYNDFNQNNGGFGDTNNFGMQNYAQPGGFGQEATEFDFSQPPAGGGFGTAGAVNQEEEFGDPEDGIDDENQGFESDQDFIEGF